MNLNNFQPSMPKLDFDANSDCEHFEYCSNLNITSPICKKYGDYRLRCNQGQWASIILLSQLLNDKEQK